MEQDWTTVTWNTSKNKTQGKSKDQVLNQARRVGAIEIVPKYNGGKNLSTQVAGTGRNPKSLDEDHETLEVPKVTISLGRRLMQARTEKHLTQKELAVAINEKATVVNDYENGRGVPNPAIINKMERVLGCRLRDPKK